MTPAADALAQLDEDLARGIAEAEEQLPGPGPAAEPRWRPNTASLGSSPRYSWDDGSKYPGGFGPTRVMIPDYWTLRARSAQLFETNLYARGIVRRLVTNVINVGLHLEATPDDTLLGLDPDTLSGWSEIVENRWRVWATTPKVCDYRERDSFGALQAATFAEALISGDVLAVLQHDRRTQLPRLRLIRGAAVQTPMHAKARKGHEIKHGVELDRAGRHVAYWVTQEDGTSKRLPAWGEKSGRRIAWLVYGADKRIDDVRGKPLLALVLQSLLEIDRYRDSAQRKAFLNSILALFVKKTEAGPGSRAVTGGAIRRGTVTSGTGDDQRTLNLAEFVPGVILDRLQQGEEPVPFSSGGTDERFGGFEGAILHGVAWALEIPPEVLKLEFNKSFSAAQAANNEFGMFLNRARFAFGSAFCAPIYAEWLVSEVLSRRIEAAGLLESWRDVRRFDVYAAWVASDWSGQIKPAVDLVKTAKGYDHLLQMGATNRDHVSRILNGTKFTRNVKQLKIENEMLADALAPLVGLAKVVSTAALTSAVSSGSGDDPEEPEDDDDDQAEDGQDDDAGEESDE